MKFLEKNLETIIYESDYDSLGKRGLYLSGNKFRQVKIGNYGIADLIYFERPVFYKKNDYNEHSFSHGTITIVELKKDVIDIDSFTQSLRYAKGIRRYLKKKDIEHKYKIEILLVGKSVDTSSSFVYLTDLVLDCGDIFIIDKFRIPPISFSIHTYSYELDGLRFNKCYDWSLKDEGF